MYLVEAINSFLEQLVGYLWSLPLVVFLISGGVFFSIYLGGIQFRGFKHAIDVVRGKYDQPDDPGEINHFKALCTALSATVGLGNIAGVAVAIQMGGPGATFWMILAGFVGMATKYAECTLAVKYRRVDKDGVVHGGPMYYIEHGLGAKFKPLAQMFAICCIFAAIGAANMFQANQVAVSLETSFGVPPWLSGILLAFFTGVVIIGGIKRIGNVASRVVPFMGITYVIACLIIILMNIESVPAIFFQIFHDAFNGSAAAGGFTGIALRQVIVQGVRRAVFSSEAGLGSAAIAHSAAKTDEPVREGSVALLEPFVDTVVICTMTALVINISGLWSEGLTGVELTAAALDQSIPGLGTYFIPIAVSLFAFSTMISWSYYGERSVDYLWGEKPILVFKYVFCLCAIIGANWKLGPILNFSDSAMALMVFPNMFALLILHKTIKRDTNAYYNKLKLGKFPTHETHLHDVLDD